MIGVCGLFLGNHKYYLNGRYYFWIQIIEYFSISFFPAGWRHFRVRDQYPLRGWPPLSLRSHGRRPLQGEGQARRRQAHAGFQLTHG